MISYIDNLNADMSAELQRFCEKSCIGLKAVAPLLAYGVSYDFARAWTQRDSNGSLTAYISSFYGDVCVYAIDGADIDEIEAFLKVIGYAGLVSNVLLFSLPADGYVMELAANEKCTAIPSEDETEICINGSLKEFYDLLSKNYPDNAFARYDDWLVDLSHRVRHGITETATLAFAGENVATASALIITDKAVLLGAISVSPLCRGKHFAHTLVRHFADMYSGRTVYIMCKPDKVGLYEKAGFTRTDEFYRI